MKSDMDALRKRGFATEADVARLKDKKIEELFTLLWSDQPVISTSAARKIGDLWREAYAPELLARLADNSGLYTKIAICNALAKGGIATAEKMTEYLGEFGNNQYQCPPKRVSLKKSYPLPRDIIARTLGKMAPEVFPAIQKVLVSEDEAKISEALDAAGYLVFYHQKLANFGNAGSIFFVVEEYGENQLILWKALQCLSAFPLEQSRRILEKFCFCEGILGKEARRSLGLINAGS